MSEEKPERRIPRRDRGDDEEFEAIIDQPGQDPLELPIEVSPIDLYDDLLQDGRPKYRSLHEAYEAFRREQDEKENHE